MGIFFIAGIHSNDLSPKGQSSAHIPHNRHVQCSSPDQGLSPLRRDRSNIHQRDLLPANKHTNFESGNLSPESNYHKPYHSLLLEYEGGSPNISPQRKVRHDSSDPSPSGNPWTKSSVLHNDSFPSRMPHHDTIGRRGEYPSRSNFIPSPQRKVRHDSPDLTPSRKPWAKHQDLSPPRKPQKNISPEKRDTNESLISHNSHYLLTKKVSEYEDWDTYPPSRTRQHSIGRRGDFLSRHNLTPSPKRKVRHDSPDLSPPRKADNKFQDLSPLRKPQKGIPTDRKDHKESPILHNSHYSIPARMPEQSLSERHVLDRSKSKGEMTDGTNAGLRTGKDLKEEIDQKKRQESQRYICIAFV